MNRKFLTIVLAAVMLFAIAGLTGCNTWRNYEFAEGDFILEISVDRTIVSVGDTIEVTVRLKNNSRHDLPVIFFNRFGDPSVNGLQNSIRIIGGVGARAVAGAHHDKTFRYDMEVYRTESIVIHDNHDFEVQAQVNLRVGTLDLFTQSFFFFTGDYPAYLERVADRVVQEIFVESITIQIYVT